MGNSTSPIPGLPAGSAGSNPAAGPGVSTTGATPTNSQQEQAFQDYQSRDILNQAGYGKSGLKMNNTLGGAPAFSSMENLPSALPALADMGLSPQVQSLFAGAAQPTMPMFAPFHFQDQFPGQQIGIRDEKIANEVLDLQGMSNRELGLPGDASDDVRNAEIARRNLENAQTLGSDVNPNEALDRTMPVKAYDELTRLQSLPNGAKELGLPKGAGDNVRNARISELMRQWGESNGFEGDPNLVLGDFRGDPAPSGAPYRPPTGIVAPESTPGFGGGNPGQFINPGVGNPNQGGMGPVQVGGAIYDGAAAGGAGLWDLLNKLFSSPPSSGPPKVKPLTAM